MIFSSILLALCFSFAELSNLCPTTRPNICQNGGLCLNRSSYFYCSCQPKFTGFIFKRKIFSYFSKIYNVLVN